MNKKPGVKRSAVERQFHQTQIAKLYVEGKRQEAIANQLGLSQQQVSRDLAEIRKVWLDNMLVAFTMHKAQEIAKLDNLELEYWEAWKRSQSARKKHRVLAVDGSKPRTEQQTDVEEGSGDPRFLRGVFDCIAKRCKLLGLEEPKEQRIIVGHVNATVEAGGHPANGVLESEERQKALVDLIRRSGVPASLLPSREKTVEESINVAPEDVEIVENP